MRRRMRDGAREMTCSFRVVVIGQRGNDNILRVPEVRPQWEFCFIHGLSSDGTATTKVLTPNVHSMPHSAPPRLPPPLRGSSQHAGHRHMNTIGKVVVLRHRREPWSCVRCCTLCTLTSTTCTRRVMQGWCNVFKTLISVYLRGDPMRPERVTNAMDVRRDMGYTEGHCGGGEDYGGMFQEIDHVHMFNSPETPGAAGRLGGAHWCLVSIVRVTRPPIRK